MPSSLYYVYLFFLFVLKSTNLSSRLHDYDNSSTIDGLEVYHAQLHRIVGDRKELLTQKVKDAVAEEVDLALADFDLNNDGHIDYTEYKLAFNRSPPP